MAALCPHDETVRSPRQTRSFARSISLVLIAAGLALLGYVGGQYWQMYRSQQQLEDQWEHQAGNAYANSAAQDAKTGTAKDASAVSRGSLGGRSIFARISIPRIHLEAIVLEGATRHELSIGPGHLPDTALPGQNGNAVVTAHRDTFFRHIFELEQGDEIHLSRDGQLFRYQVTGKKIVKPADVRVLAPTSDAELTLITCYPVHYIGPAPERLVVVSKLVP